MTFFHSLCDPFPGFSGRDQTAGEYDGRSSHVLFEMEVSLAEEFDSSAHSFKPYSLHSHGMAAFREDIFFYVEAKWDSTSDYRFHNGD